MLVPKCLLNTRCMMSRLCMSQEFTTPDPLVTPVLSKPGTSNLGYQPSTLCNCNRPLTPYSHLQLLIAHISRPICHHWELLPLNVTLSPRSPYRPSSRYLSQPSTLNQLLRQPLLFQASQLPPRLLPPTKRRQQVRAQFHTRIRNRGHSSAALSISGSRH